MKNLHLFAIAALFPALCAATTFHVSGTDSAPWAKIFGSVGMVEAGKDEPGILVAGANEQIDAAALSENRILIIEGTGPAAQSLGIVPRPDTHTAVVRQICDIHGPKMQVFWEQAVNVAPIDLPAGFQVFATEKWTGIPVLAGKRTAHGAILWIATPPGSTGIERYPYLLQALVDLGLSLPLRTTSLWAFFDSSYRIRADVDYLARRWRESGVGVLHVAAWHNVEPDATQDAFLKKLDRGLPSKRDSGVCVAGTAPCQRKILGGSSGVAREDSRRSRCATGLAQIDELAESGLSSRGGTGDWYAASQIRLGRRERGGAVFRIVGRSIEPGTIYADE